MDGGEEEREYDSFARGEGVALLRGEVGNLCRVKLDAIATAIHQGRMEIGIVRVSSGGGGGGRQGRKLPEQGGGGGQPGTWPGLRDARSERGREMRVGGNRAPSNLVFVKLRGRKIEGAERALCFSTIMVLLYSVVGAPSRSITTLTLTLEISL